MAERKPYRPRSSVGPNCIVQCMANKIAQCQCVILQPTPDFESPRAASSGERPPSIPKTLIPSGSRTLVLWKEELSDEYHLTAINVEKDEVFLDLPLSGSLTGKLEYRQDHALWHEFTVYGETPSNQNPKTFVFNLQADGGNRHTAVEFSKKLSRVFEELKAVPEKVIDIFPPTFEEPKKKSNFNCHAYTELQDQSLARGDFTLSLKISNSLASPVAMATLPRTPSQGPALGAEAPSLPLAVGDFSNGISTARLSGTLSSKEAEKLSIDLASAIALGNEAKAIELACRLAQNRTNITVRYDAAAEEQKAREQEISVIIHVEDRESSGLTMNDVKVRPSDTVLDLKHMFLGKFNFPLEVQKWIIGNKIRSDEDTLSRCEVMSSGATLYLYLLNAKAANIKHEDFERQRRALVHPGADRSLGRSNSGYETMMLPFRGGQPSPSQGHQELALVPPQGQAQGQVTPVGGTVRQQSHLSTASSSSSLAATSLGMTDVYPRETLLSSSPGSGLGQPGSGTRLTQGGTLVAAGRGGRGGHSQSQAPRGPPDAFTMEESTTIGSQGWQCERCTLINQPTRPGCEACGDPRPADYQVPTNFIASQEEWERLRKEQELEAMMQQIQSGQGWHAGLGRGDATHTNPNDPHTTEKLTPETLDLILRFNDAIQDQYSARGSHVPQSAADPSRMGRGGHSQLVPSGGRGGVRGDNPQQQEAGRRQSVQNLDLGEEVIDSWVTVNSNDDSHS